MNETQRRILAEVEAALRRKRLSARAASLAASGTGSVVANLRRGSSPSAETLAMLADVLDLEFYFGTMRDAQSEPFGSGLSSSSVRSPEPTPDTRDTRDTQSAQHAPVLSSTQRLHVPLLGRCSAGEAIVFDEPQTLKGARYLLKLFRCAAVLVSGESMSPAFHHGDVVLVDLAEITSPEALLGKRCLVELAPESGGGGYLKQVLAGSAPGLYTLTSINSAYAPIQNVRIRRARRIIGSLVGQGENPR